MRSAVAKSTILQLRVPASVTVLINNVNNAKVDFRKTPL
jgi:hypothetical protein